MASRLDPTHETALLSLDLGHVLSMDGRAHPLDAMTPISFVPTPITVIPPGSQSGPDIPPVQGPGDIGALPDGMTHAGTTAAAMKSLLPAHFGARAVVSLIAVAIIVIVAARLVL